MTKLEEVARAIRDEDNPKAKGMKLCPVHYINLAKAALEAVKEPSPEMCEAGALKMWGAMTENEPQSAVIMGQPKEVWQAMIQSALDE